jgi:uncharacterized protein
VPDRTCSVAAGPRAASGWPCRRPRSRVVRGVSQGGPPPQTPRLPGSPGTRKEGDRRTAGGSGGGEPGRKVPARTHGVEQGGNGGCAERRSTSAARAVSQAARPMARRNAPGGGGPSECQGSQLRGAGACRGHPSLRVRELFPLKLIAFLLSLPIHLYRWTLSPLLPRACRFHPSCSAYALGALQEHGPFRGFWLAVRRLGRCNPFNPGGLDPVPPRPGRI